MMCVCIIHCLLLILYHPSPPPRPAFGGRLPGVNNFKIKTHHQTDGGPLRQRIGCRPHLWFMEWGTTSEECRVGCWQHLWFLGRVPTPGDLMVLTGCSFCMVRCWQRLSQQPLQRGSYSEFSSSSRTAEGGEQKMGQGAPIKNRSDRMKPLLQPVNGSGHGLGGDLTGA